MLLTFAVFVCFNFSCSFANIVLWNVFLQSFGYETGKKVSLNRKQMKSLNGKLEGPYQILLSKHLPPKGLPKNMDWLDSEVSTILFIWR